MLVLGPDGLDDLNEAATKRWRTLDPMLPPARRPSDLPDGCLTPLLATGQAGPDGRPAGVAVCRHQRIPDDALEQVWGAVHRFELTPRLLEPATSLDDLLGRWRDHLATLPEAREDDSAAIVNWPSRDVSGVQALIDHGMQPLVVLAVRPAGRSAKSPAKRPATYGTPPPGVVIRTARPDDLEAVTAMELGVIHYDAQVGAAIVRPATEALVRQDTRRALTKRPDWAWVAERDGTLVGLVHVQPPEESAWIASMTRPGTTAYLQTMFVGPHERSGGLGAALVERAHAELDARGVTTTLLHHAQVNPLSAPFWNRMGYRPLWTGWETRPAVALRLVPSRCAEGEPAGRRPPDAQDDSSCPRRNAEVLLMVASEKGPAMLWRPANGNGLKRTRAIG